MRILLELLSVVTLLAGHAGLRADDGPLWKVGVARAKITPGEPMWMSGYGPRLASEKLHDLWIKVLALEAPDGHQAVVITSDVCGFSKLTCDAVCAELQKRCGLDRADVMLTCSHTHTGPALRECLQVCWPWIDNEARALVERYSIALEAKLVETVEEALSNLAPARVSAGEGTADFAVNRRNNAEEDVPRIRESGGVLRGPVDHSLPVLVIRTPSGALRAVLFGYACHTTTLASTEWSGDYAGFAMLALEARHPGVDALFYQGCGADQNPLPRRTVEVCRMYGEKLADGVEAVLAGELRPVAARLRTAFDFVNLDFKRGFTADYLHEKSRETSANGRFAARFLEQLNAGRPLATSHPYAIQAWKLGGQQLWISLSGEVVVDYSLTYKDRYGKQTWVNGFAHDLVCYIPSARILREGGGQEIGVLWSYGLPAFEWADDIEDRIHAGVDRIVKRLE